MLTQVRNVIREKVQSPKRAGVSTFDLGLAEKAKKKVVNLNKGEVSNGNDTEIQLMLTLLAIFTANSRQVHIN